MAEQRIPICSAKRDNRVLGYIEGSEAFDLFGRRRADYNPNTGLLYGLRDGGVVGYVTFDSKFAGLSRMVDEMFPKTYEVIPQQSPKDYVNNLVVEPQAGEQANEVSGRRDAEYDFSMREINETPVSAPPLQHEPGATFFPESHDGAYQQTRPSERCSNEPDLGVTGARQGDAENEPVSSINQTASPPLVEHDEAPARTPLPKAYDASPDEGAESERASSDSRALGVVETFMQCVAEYVHSIPNDIMETPSPLPSRQDEVPNLDSNFDLMDTPRKQLRGDGFAVGPGESFVEREAQDDTSSSTNEKSQLHEEAETNFFSVSDDNNPSQDDLRGERSSEGRRSPVADASFGEAESGDEANSTNETPSPSLSENGEQAGANLDSKSDDSSPEYVHSIPNDIKETPRPPPSRQDEVANLDSNFDLKDTHREQLRGDGFAAGPGESFVKREAQVDTFSSTSESPASSQQDEEAETNIFSVSDDNNPSQDHLRGEGSSEGRRSLVAGASFGAEAGDEANSIDETPSPSLSENGEQAGADLDSKSDDNSPEEHGPSQPYGNLVERGEVESEGELYSLNQETSASERDEEAGVNPDSKSDDHIFSSEHSHGNNHAEPLSPLGAGNSFDDAVSGDELNNISDTPGELLSGQHEAEATPFSEPADDGPQENFESVLDANSTDIVGQRDAPDGDSVTGIEEKPNLPLIEQKEAEQSPLSDLNDDSYQESAASGQYLEHSPSAPAEPGKPTHLPGQQSAPDLAKAFFEVDLERAVAMVRSELARPGHGADPTADFFSVDLERAVDIVRKEFETKVCRTDLGALDLAAPGVVQNQIVKKARPTGGGGAAADEALFEADMQSALSAMLNEFEKGAG